MLRRQDRAADLAVVIISTNEAHWLEPCLSTVLQRAGGANLDVVVVDNSSTDGTRELVESNFPAARVVGSPNLGFAHGNNRGLEATDSRYALLLNPDTEVVAGTFGELVKLLDRSPQIGIAGVRQVTPDGELSPSIRRFPSVSRALCEALFSERWPIHPSWSGERVLDAGTYEREQACDWVLGSFMLVRREALMSAGLLDERFFIYSEEPDLCTRVMQAGWQVRYLPQMTIVHHHGKGGVRPRMIAQDAYTRKQYANKYFGPARRRSYLAAVGLRHVVRYVSAGADAAHSGARREAARQALLTLSGRGGPPVGSPPQTAVAPRRVGAEQSAPASSNARFMAAPTGRVPTVGQSASSER